MADVTAEELRVIDLIHRVNALYRDECARDGVPIEGGAGEHQEFVHVLGHEGRRVATYEVRLADATPRIFRVAGEAAH